MKFVRSAPSDYDPRLREQQAIAAAAAAGFSERELATKSEFSSSAITIDIHLLDPDVDRILAEYERVSPGVVLDLIGASGGGGRGSESVQAS